MDGARHSDADAGSRRHATHHERKLSGSATDRSLATHRRGGVGRRAADDAGIVALPGMTAADPDRLHWSALASVSVYNYSTLLGGPLGKSLAGEVTRCHDWQRRSARCAPRSFLACCGSAGICHCSSILVGAPRPFQCAGTNRRAREPQHDLGMAGRIVRGNATRGRNPLRGGTCGMRSGCWCGLDRDDAGKAVLRRPTRRSAST